MSIFAAKFIEMTKDIIKKIIIKFMFLIIKNFLLLKSLNKLKKVKIKTGQKIKFIVKFMIDKKRKKFRINNIFTDITSNKSKYLMFI